jgi:integrase/recombinase XerD
MAKSKIETQRNRLKEATEAGDVAERDAELIDEYLTYIEGQKAETTCGNHAFYLNKMAERSATSLADATLADLNETLDSMKGGTHPDVKDEGIGIGNYQATLRVFYRYHDHLGIDPEAIDIERSEGRDLSPSDLLYQDEIDDLLHACFENARDRAFIALALATGQRLDAIRTLRLKHIKTNGSTMEIELNEEEGALKGASGTKPLLWAKHYVRPWYESHPYKDNPESALFCATDKAVLNRETVEPAQPMHPATFRRILVKRAEKAGIDKRVWPHLLRHCAITRMVSEGLSEQQIKQIAGWAGDSSEFDTYVNLADNLNNDAIRNELGYPETGTNVVIGRPTLNECPECGDRLPDGTERCKTCGSALTHREHLEGGSGRGNEVDDRMRESYREAGDMDTVEKVQLLNDLLDDPEVRALLQDRMD